MDAGHDSKRKANIRSPIFIDRVNSVLKDIHAVRQHPLLSDVLPAHGFFYAITTGQLYEVGTST